jgi:cell division protein FtsQ
LVVDDKRNRRRERRRRGGNYSLQFSLIALIAFIIFAALSLTVLFRAKTVVLYGASPYSADEIVAASGIRSGDNLIRTNTAEREKAVAQKLAYVETAEVKRVFPASFRITVAPCVETANLEQDGVWYLISATGKILKISDFAHDENLLTFYGCEPAEGLAEGGKFESSDPKKTENIYELMAQTRAGVMAGRIKSIDVADNYDIRCNYEDRITIAVGSAAEIEYKYRLADTIIRNSIGADEEGTLTLRPEIASVSFIDKYGLEYNESVYIDNLRKAAGEEDPDDAENALETALSGVDFE